VGNKDKINHLTKYMQGKILVVLGLLTLALLCLIIKLLYLHFEKGDEYSKKVLDQQEYSSQTIPYKRGDIVDRNGTILATSKDVYNVVLDCKVLNAREKSIDETVAALVKCFPDLTEDIIRDNLKEKATSQYCVLLKKVSYEDTAEFRAMQEMEDSKIAGVWFEKEYIRYYPYNSLAASLIGFASSGNVGLNGLESYYNDDLNGINGKEYGYLNSDSNIETTIVDAVDGKTIVSTIDANIQQIVEEKIMNFNNAHSGEDGNELGSKNTAVIVMDPNNGEVLAMANYPSYDLNNPRDLSAYYSDSELDEMTEDEKLDILNEIWNNYCITNTYEPGSTAKPFTVACGIDSGKLNGDETYICNGYEKVGGFTIHCVNHDGHGKETIEQAINNSCNDALMQMGKAIGIELFTRYQTIFGFGKRTGIDLTGESRTDSLIYTSETMDPTALATNSFGQNFNVTMIQLASGFCSLINGGNYYKPHVVKEIDNSDGSLSEEIEPLLVKQTISKETSSYLRKYLYTTVNNGTAKSAKVSGYTMGGKTGTAEKLPRGNHKYLVSFIGFAPATNPEVLIYVVIDEPNVDNQAQSSLATNLAKEILTEVLPYMDIFPDEDKEGAEPEIYSVTVEEDYAGDIFN